MGVERVEQGAQDTALWGSYVQGDGVGGELAHFHYLRSAGDEIKLNRQDYKYRIIIDNEINTAGQYLTHNQKKRGSIFLRTALLAETGKLDPRDSAAAGGLGSAWESRGRRKT